MLGHFAQPFVVSPFCRGCLLGDLRPLSRRFNTCLDEKVGKHPSVAEVFSEKFPLEENFN